jgi:phosphoribosyl-AMP cyclohydrolase / phosphoribosyl-ATP pyrophosphohydrolase
MKLHFEKYADGLLPAVIQDHRTNIVLMVGFMNAEALEKTIADKKVCFYSRKKKSLWVKGATSGNYLFVKSILHDCDADTLLIKAEPAGPVCHTGSDTCFGETNQSENFLNELQQLIIERKTAPVASSYTSSLFQKGINKVAQKVGEEATELIIEAKDDNDELFLNEAADLLFHTMVLLAAKDKQLSDVVNVLRSRQAPRAPR